MPNKRGKGKRAKRFSGVVLDGHKGLAFEVPFSPAVRWGSSPVRLWPRRRGFPVRGTVNGIRFESVVVGRSKRFFVLVTRELKRDARLEAGAAVKVSLEAMPEEDG